MLTIAMNSVPCGSSVGSVTRLVIGASTASLCMSSAQGLGAGSMWVTGTLKKCAPDHGKQSWITSGMIVMDRWWTFPKQRWFMVKGWIEVLMDCLSDSHTTSLAFLDWHVVAHLPKEGGGVTVLILVLCSYFYIWYNMPLIQYKKCQSKWHMTMSIDYIKVNCLIHLW